MDDGDGVACHLAEGLHSDGDAIGLADFLVKSFSSVTWSPPMTRPSTTTAAVPQLAWGILKQWQLSRGYVFRLPRRQPCSVHYTRGHRKGPTCQIADLVDLNLNAGVVSLEAKDLHEGALGGLACVGDLVGAGLQVWDSVFG